MADLPGKLPSSVAEVGIGMPQINRDSRQLQAWCRTRYRTAF